MKTLEKKSVSKEQIRKANQRANRRELFLNEETFVYKGAVYQYQADKNPIEGCSSGMINRCYYAKQFSKIIMNDYVANVIKAAFVQVTAFTYVFDKKINVTLRYEDMKFNWIEKDLM